MVSTLREYIRFAEERNWILHVKDSVSTGDLPELIHELSRKDKILLFHRVDGYGCKVIANLVFSHKVLAELLGDPKHPYKVFLDRLKVMGEKVVEAPKESYESFDVTEKDISHIIPILKHYQEDCGPYITTGIVSSIDPETDVVCRGIHRLGFRGKNKLGVAFMNPPLRDVFPKYAKQGKKMPVSISIGVDPLTFLSMALKAPNNVDKIQILAGLRDGKATVMPSFNSSITVPYGSEYLLEGYVDPQLSEPDGPLGEISGYYLSFGKTPTVVVQRISHLPSPIYHALLPTSLEGDTYLTFVSRAHLGDGVEKLFPFVLDMNLIRGTFGASCVVRIRPVERELIGNLILYLLSFPMIKKVCVVDEDVDIYDLYQVEWAVITRCKGDEDIVLIPNLKGQPIDPLSKGVHGITKIGINATVQGKDIEKTACVSKGSRENIEKILSSLEV